MAYPKPGYLVPPRAEDKIFHAAQFEPISSKKDDDAVYFQGPPAKKKCKRQRRQKNNSVNFSDDHSGDDEMKECPPSPIAFRIPESYILERLKLIEEKIKYYEKKEEAEKQTERENKALEKMKRAENIKTFKSRTFYQTKKN